MSFLPRLRVSQRMKCGGQGGRWARKARDFQTGDLDSYPESHVCLGLGKKSTLVKLLQGKITLITNERVRSHASSHFFPVLNQEQVL